MNPELSIIVTAYNKEHQIAKVIQGILDNTESPFELVAIYDGCTDKTMDVANRAIAEYDTDYVISYKCIESIDIHETKANNVAMKTATGKYFILVQDDMMITERGWEKRMLAPIKKWYDVFAVSAKNAHSFICKPNWITEYTCTEFAKRDVFQIRQAVNRGPLALRSAIIKEVSYLDEAYAPCYFDDMDLCVRAYLKLGALCGVYQIGYKNLQRSIYNDSIFSTGEKVSFINSRNRQIFWNRYRGILDGTNHDEDRELIYGDNEKM